MADTHRSRTAGLFGERRHVRQHAGSNGAELGGRPSGAGDVALQRGRGQFRLPAHPFRARATVERS